MVKDKQQPSGEFTQEQIDEARKLLEAAGEAPPAEEQRPEFNFAAGTGVVRAKIGTDFVTMYYGRMAIPGYGQCYVDGRAAKSDAEMKLDVKAATDRRVVATLTLPRGEMDTREGTLRVGKGKGSKVWKVRATVRMTDGKARLVLRMPDVKIAQPKAF